MELLFVRKYFVSLHHLSVVASNLFQRPTLLPNPARVDGTTIHLHMIICKGPRTATDKGNPPVLDLGSACLAPGT